MNLDASQDTIERIREARSEYGMHIALAHDESWMIEQSDSVLMSLLSDDKKGEWLERLKKNDQP
jgi:hypothetical protein